MEADERETAALEEGLRAALDAQSALVTSSSLQPGTQPRRESRARWQQPRLLLTAGAVAAAVAAAVVMVPHDLGGQDRHHRQAAAAGRLKLDGLSFTVPRGWKAWEPEPGKQACVQPPGTPHDLDHCWATGIQVATETGDQAGILDQDNGWQSQPSCWTADGQENTSDPITDSRLVDRAAVSVSGHKAAYRAWQVTCHSGQKFTARLWWIPAHQTSIRAFRLAPHDAPLADRLVSSITLR
ncbi:hypothetical protein ACFVZM_14110 [Streptomyces sioyaensis]|uniref:hypothetical protein n=1 Tax=Streptomyces sioyaensis TaxID=67364 RepID=UPI0036C1C0E8